MAPIAGRRSVPPQEITQEVTTVQRILLALTALLLAGPATNGQIIAVLVDWAFLPMPVR
jgi:hypothetical protein